MGVAAAVAGVAPVAITVAVVAVVATDTRNPPQGIWRDGLRVVSPSLFPVAGRKEISGVELSDDGLEEG